MGGNWLSTNLKAEQNAIRERNNLSNGLLIVTCRHMKYISDNSFKSYILSRIVINSFVYNATGNWHFTEQEQESTTSQTYEDILLDCYNDNSFSL